MRVGIACAAIAALGVGAALTAPDARACGGCFPPSGEQQSVVTDHRMVLSVSKERTTLYDQIQYTGNPSEFAWVLPIAGTVDVGLSADTVFGALHNLSAVVVQEPPRNCPPRPQCGDESEAFAPASDGNPNSGGGGGVDVLKRETVGPYETVQLKSEDPAALDTWLSQNGFNIPDDIKPVISQYVGEHFNFLALKLKPGQGVSSMRPVRVTSPGASAVLPLRMVAAGTGANVGITLWVLGEGRYEPQNFPSFVIKSEDLSWDWATGTSDYKELRAQRSQSAPGKTWEIESSESVPRQQIESIVRRLGSFGQTQDYLPITDDSGNVTKTAEQIREADLATLFAGIAPGQEHLTRLRSDLSRAALATDLVMTASADQTSIDQIRIPKKEKGQPLCAIYDSDCRQVGTAPRDEAAARSYTGNGGESFGCKATPSSRSPITAFAGVASFLGLVIARTIRERRRRDD